MTIPMYAFALTVANHLTQTSQRKDIALAA